MNHDIGETSALSSVPGILRFCFESDRGDEFSEANMEFRVGEDSRGSSDKRISSWIPPVVVLLPVSDNLAGKTP